MRVQIFHNGSFLEGCFKLDQTWVSNAEEAQKFIGSWSAPGRPSFSDRHHCRPEILCNIKEE